MKSAIAQSLAALLALTACGADPSLDTTGPVVNPEPPAVEPDPYALSVPSTASLSIDFDGTVSAANAAGALTAEVQAAFSSPEEMNGARAIAAQMDAGLDLVARLLPPAGSSTRTVSHGVRAIGPAVRCLVATSDACPEGASLESELVVRNAGEGDFSWVVRVRGIGWGDSDWIQVYIGRVGVGEVEGARSGQFALLLDELRQVAWALPVSGRVLGGFTLRPDCRALMYRAEGLAFGDAAPATGRLFVQRCANGDLRVRFTASRDLIPGPGGHELVTNHVGLTSRGAVAHTIVSNWNPAFGYQGDVPWTSWPGEAYVVVRSCFGTDQRPIHREGFTCAVETSLADCLSSEPTALAGFEGGSWDSCGAIASEGAARAPDTAISSLYDESPEAGFVAPPVPPAGAWELIPSLGI